jgi:hypothetical protein
MKKIIENNIATIIVIALFSVILLSSCGTTKQGGSCGGNPFNEGY